MSEESFDQFRYRVLEDEPLQHDLRNASDHKTFLALVVSLGGRLGYTFNAEDVESAIRVSRRAWLERSLQ